MQTQSPTGRITTSLSLVHQRKNKQKLSTNLTLYKLTQTTGPTLGGQKPKGRKNSTLQPGKRRPQHNKLKRKKERKKIQRNTTQMKKQARNTEVQINEERM